jgi:hypothetical protein
MQAGLKVILPATLVLGGALGFAWWHSGPARSEDAIARLEQRHEELRQQVKALAQRDCATAAVPASGSADVRAEITRAVREELHTVRPAQAVTDVVPDPSRPAEPTRDNVIAREECMRLIDQAVRSREWNDEQAARFQALMEQLTDAQRDEVLERLVAVLNGGEVRITTEGAPF